MLTFLDLVNAFITELGINGGNLLSSTGGGTLAPGAATPGQQSSTLSPEAARIVSYIADADYEIQNLHHDWNFLWRQYQNTLAVGQDWLATPQTFGTVPTGYISTFYSLRRVDRESLAINYVSQQASYRPRFQEWRHFERAWQSRGAKYPSDNPTNWTITPAGNPLLSHTSINGYGYQYECWIRPRRMNSDGDISPLVLAVTNNNQFFGSPKAPMQPPYQLSTPSNASPLDSASPVGNNQQPTSQSRYESCRIIIARAKIIWAEIEGATDIMQAALAEYQDLLEELRADQLPGMNTDRMSESDIPLVIDSDNWGGYSSGRGW